jgi:HAD superfamily hydrolase (TIGR01490 family)
MRLALFDLDHTLIPFDSGLAWLRFLIARGVIAVEAEAVYLDHCRAYVAGTLDIHAMHRAVVAPLRRFSRATLHGWVIEFETQVRPQIPDAMRALVQGHRSAGDLCAIVTATERLIAEPFARLFGIGDLVATEGAIEHDHYTGEIDGEPCFREHKVSRVERWLGERGLGLASFGESWFYSDSCTDLPLLRAVTHPVAVRPDERLRAQALGEGWRVIDG